MKEEIKAQMTIVKATADRAVQMKKIHDAQWIQVVSSSILIDTDTVSSSHIV